VKTIAQFNSVLTSMGSDLVLHREQGGTPCPCRTPEGFRDPSWHAANPGAPVCNEQGYLDPVVTEFTVKGSIQPAQTAYRRLSQRVSDLLGDIQFDDKIGILPCSWGGNTVNLRDWSEAGEDYIEYDGDRYTVVSADKIPDVDGDPSHHWETGLRILTASRPS
jgi:hypothetical protein